jgi:hypothetical protein
MFKKIQIKIEFEVPSEEKAREIYDSICVGNEFDFRRLRFVNNFETFCDIINREEDKEYFWKRVFYKCNLHFWFFEYMSCEISELEWVGSKASFTFQTLRSVPHEVVGAFASHFKVPFTLKYIENTGRYWGIETFELDEKERIRKTSERICMEEDFRDLQREFMELKP